MQKKPIVLIMCILILLVAIVMFVVYIANGGSTDIDAITLSSGESKVDMPTIKLTAYPEEETDGYVEISIEATIANGNEIASITTPDGKTTGYIQNKKYIVTENGQYTFSAKASNGQVATQTIDIQNIIRASADKPYIPDGFEHVKGTEVDTGFVIKDKNGNEYVWVPVESGKPVRTSPSSKYFESDYTASALTNSIAKYYGFYIAKYEASKDTVNGIIVAKSVGGSIPWSNVNYDDAFNACKNTATAYNYIGVRTSLISSYAWDTTLSWLNNSVTNYSTSRDYGNYSNQILNTGATATDIVNGIADMSGNLREWTTEKYDEERVSDEEETNNNLENVESIEDKEISYRVVRGGSATMDKIANSRIGERKDLQDNYWGFRMVLYKD